MADEVNSGQGQAVPVTPSAAVPVASPVAAPVVSPPVVPPVPATNAVAQTASLSQLPAESSVSSGAPIPSDVPSDRETALKEETVYSWQASEYIHHDRGPKWFAGLAGAVVVLIGIGWWFKAWLSIAMFVVMGAAIMVYARRPPRTLSYQLDHDKLIIDNQAYPLSDFRSFGVVPDPEWHMINLEPKKRFSPPIGLLFTDQDLDEITTHLELHLQHVDRRLDLVDRVSRYLRF